MSFKKRPASTEKSASLTMANRAFNPALAADDTEMHYSTIDDSQCKKKGKGSINSKSDYDYASPDNVDTLSRSDKSSVNKRGRKKSCLIYETVDGKDEIRKRPADDTRLMLILFIVSFTIAAVCLLISLCAVLGATFAEDREDCNNCSVPIFMAQADVIRLEVVEYTFKEQIHNRLQKAEQHYLKLSSRTPIPGFQGPIGPPGPKGVTGPAGEEGDVRLTRCRYEYATSRTPLLDPSNETITSTDQISAADGYVLTDAYCSMVGAREYALASETSNNGTMIQYYCICGGKAQMPAFAPVAGIVECTIHWWQCPLV